MLTVSVSILFRDWTVNWAKYFIILPFSFDNTQELMQCPDINLPAREWSLCDPESLYNEYCLHWRQFSDILDEVELPAGTVKAQTHSLHASWSWFFIGISGRAVNNVAVGEVFAAGGTFSFCWKRRCTDPYERAGLLSKWSWGSVTHAKVVLCFPSSDYRYNTSVGRTCCGHVRSICFQ
jgi:hypothetical protein